MEMLYKQELWSENRIMPSTDVWFISVCLSASAHSNFPYELLLGINTDPKIRKKPSLISSSQEPHLAASSIYDFLILLILLEPETYRVISLGFVYTAPAYVTAK